MRTLGIAGTARASFSVYTSSEDISILAHALAALRTKL
jgi:selenocysteine lyase/cysteine desulfurase